MTDLGIEFKWKCKWKITCGSNAWIWLTTGGCNIRLVGIIGIMKKRGKEYVKGLKKIIKKLKQNKEWIMSKGV